MSTTTESITTLRPGEPGYDAAVRGFQTHRSQAPAAVVVARSADDVAAAVRRARRDGRRVAVQATGHGVGAVDPEALLVATGGLDEVTIDPHRRTARIGAGARWGAVLAATAAHGLAPLSGSAHGVGVAGYLVNGGVALLGRNHGWAAEQVRAFEIVTASGAEQRITDGDVFWALRGGGSSFAIVTAVEIGLLPLTTVYGGGLFLPAGPDTVRGWRDWAATAPEELSTSAAVVPFPDVDGLPAPLRGRTLLHVRVACEGGDGERLVAPLRALAEPVLDGLRELPWSASHTIHNDPEGPVASSGTTVALAALPDAVLDAALASREAPDVRRVVEFRRLGGAFTRPGAGPVRRDAEWSAGVVSILTPDVDVAAAAQLDVRFRTEIEPWTVGRLANFLFGEGADPAAVAAAYSPADLARLREIRAEADPDGILMPGAPLG